MDSRLGLARCDQPAMPRCSVFSCSLRPCPRIVQAKGECKTGVFILQNRTLKDPGRLLFHSGADFLYSVRSLVILLHLPRVAVVKPCHRMTVGGEHCRAGHVQA
jgi:hypothetical protein